MNEAIPRQGTRHSASRSPRSPYRHSAIGLFVTLVLTTAVAAGCGTTKKERATPITLSSPYGLTLPRATEGVYSLRELEGSVALVSFFATWCFPCMVEVPTYQDLQREFGSEGFQVVGIGMDLEGRKVLLPFVEAYQVDFPVLIADEDVRAGRTAFGRIEQLPSTFILDRRGRTVAAYAGPANPSGLRELIAKLVKQPR